MSIDGSPEPTPRPGARRAPVVVGLALAGVLVVVLGAAAAWALLGGDDGGSGANRDAGTERPGDEGELGGQGTTVVVAPGDDLQALVERHRAGTTFELEAGVHRLAEAEPKDGMVFTGPADAVLSGAVVVDGWRAAGGVWEADGPVKEGRIHGECNPDATRCDHPEELFVDGARQRHVDSASAVGEGEWHYEERSGRLTMGSDPTGRTVELSVVSDALASSAADVIVRGITIRNYANPAQRGAIHITGPGWLVEDVTVADTHGVGLVIAEGADRTVVRGGVTRGNGQMGMGAGGVDGNGPDDVLVDGIEIADNNQVGFDPDWEAGGAKFTLTDRLTVRNTYAHGNDGPGLWFDEAARDTLVEDNLVVDNGGAGIYYEISYRGRIVDNEVRGNGFRADGWFWGAGILISASPDVEVVGNTVSGNFNAITAVQQDRGTGPDGPRVVTGLRVERNTVGLADGMVGMVAEDGLDDVFSQDNRFVDNEYVLGSRSDPFAWEGRSLTESEWREQGLG